MSNLDRALYCVEELGWSVFPAYYRGGQHKPLVAWGQNSSNDPETVRKWDEQFQGCYFCTNFKASNIINVDVDLKPGTGRDGKATMEELAVFYDFPESMLITSPSGGSHTYYIGELKAQGVNKLGPGVDLPGMAPCPGTIVPGKGEYRIERNGYIAPFPAELWGAVKGADDRERPTEALVPEIEVDLPDNILRAVDLLSNTPPALEGASGDAHTYNTAMLVRDLGISRHTCLAMMLRFWNDRCEPPWTVPDLSIKIDNAYQYGKTAPGADTPAGEFGKIEPSALGDLPPAGEVKRSRLRPVCELLKDLKPIEWLVEGYLEHKTVGVIFGDTGTMKSYLAIDMGLHIATGKQWLGKETKQGPVIYIAGEGHSGVVRRVKAWVKHHGITEDFPFFVSECAVALNQPEERRRLNEELQEIITFWGAPALIIIDTLAANFGAADENSTQDMNSFINTVGAIRHAYSCTVTVIHHTGHAAKDRPRGAYALIAGVDSAYKIEKDGADAKAFVMRAPLKMKDGVPPEDTWFDIVPVSYILNGELDEESNLIIRPSDGSVKHEISSKKGGKDRSKYGKNMLTALAILEDAPEGVLLDDELRLQFKARRGSLYHSHQYTRALTQLEQKGRIIADGVLIRLVRSNDTQIISCEDPGG